MRISSKLLSLILTIAMMATLVVSMIPAVSAAAPTLTLCTGTLKAGDKVVIATADKSQGVTGFNGSKDFTVGTDSSKWVQYTVAVVDGGYTLKDEGAGKFIKAPGGNEFKYDANGGTFTVGSDGLLISTVESRNLCINAADPSKTYYRFYKGKADTDGYTLMYVFVVEGGSTGEGSGSEGEGGNEDTPTFVKPTTPEAIVNALYALEKGETLAEGPYTLEGVIKTIKEGYSEQYNNITVEIVVGDMTDKPVVCYRLRGDDAATIAEGDTIKVTGELTNYNGTYEFTSGCTFTLVKKAEKPFEKPTTPEAIVDALYALKAGETLPGGNYTLTGKITEIDTPYSEDYKNISVIIVVGDMTDKPIICFRLRGEGADALKVGDTIEVTGTLVDYSGKKEFNSGCTFTLVAAGDEGGEVTPPTGGGEGEGGEVTPPTGGDEGGEVTPPTGGDQGGEVTPPTTNPETGDSVVAYVAMAVVALFGIAYVSKKR